MNFTDDTEEALRSAVWLVNSAEDPETLETLADYDAFLADFPYSGRLDRDQAELTSLRDLRPRLRAMLLAPRLVRHDGVDWHLHAVADERPLAERVLIETAMALIDVIRADEGSRISICADDTCEALALDLSRNRSKRFCSTTCTNRNAVAAYRARRASA